MLSIFDRAIFHSLYPKSTLIFKFTSVAFQGFQIHKRFSSSLIQCKCYSWFSNTNPAPGFSSEFKHISSDMSLGDDINYTKQVFKLSARENFRNWEEISQKQLNTEFSVEPAAPNHGLGGTSHTFPSWSTWKIVSLSHKSTKTEVEKAGIYSESPQLHHITILCL